MNKWFISEIKLKHMEEILSPQWRNDNQNNFDMILHQLNLQKWGEKPWCCKSCNLGSAIQNKVAVSKTLAKQYGNIQRSWKKFIIIAVVILLVGIIQEKQKKKKGERCAHCCDKSIIIEINKKPGKNLNIQKKII